MAFHGRWWIHYPIDFINFSRKSVSRGPLSFNLTHALLKRPIALLDVTELRKRRDAATRMTPASANRLATILKAALNLAASTDERLSTRPWEIALAALPEATMADNVVLPEETIRQLVQAARTQSLKFGLLVKVLALTGARISQIRRWQVGDLVGRSAFDSVIGQRAKEACEPHPVPIPAGLADKLCMAAAGRALSAPLLASGAPRGTSDHARPFKRAAGVIGEDAGRVSSYALRHSHITAQLLAGLPVLASHTSELVRGAMVDFDRRPGGDAIFFGGEPLSKCLY